MATFRARKLSEYPNYLLDNREEEGTYDTTCTENIKISDFGFEK